MFSRSAKSITLSHQARAALGIDEETLPPNEVIRALLCAPVDLLWNGGIGTYVKAASETHAEAGDKANDAVRVDAAELRCRVVGEGGNLGLTQMGRVEYALAGGRINTDAIDNSGGVDCSDREVNIKILLDSAVADGELTLKQRDELLVEMTSEVAELVLQDDYEQTETLTLAEAQAAPMVDVHARFLDDARERARLDRGLEALPFAERARRAKAGRRRADPARARGGARLQQDRPLRGAARLRRARGSAPVVRARSLLPLPLPERFGERMRSHRLRREIIATQVANNVLHGGGTTFTYRLHEETRRIRVGDRARLRDGARHLRDAPAVEGDRGARQPRGRRRPDQDAARGTQADRARLALAAAQRPPADRHRRHGGPLRPGRAGALRLDSPLPGSRRPRAAARARRAARVGRRAGEAGPARGHAADDVRDLRRRGGRRRRGHRRGDGRRRALPARRPAPSCTGCATASSLSRATTAGALWPAPRCATTSTACIAS